MVFDITDLDRKEVLTAFYNNSPRGLGSKLKEPEADLLLERDNELDFGKDTIAGSYLVDYHKGVPVKWSREIKRGRYLLDVLNYDLRNGPYRAFEILVNVFPTNSFSLVDKSYGAYWNNSFKEKSTEYGLERIKKNRSLLREWTKTKHPYGIRYELESNKINLSEMHTTS